MGVFREIDNLEELRTDGGSCIGFGDERLNAAIDWD